MARTHQPSLPARGDPPTQQCLAGTDPLPSDLLGLGPVWEHLFQD